MCTNSFAGTHTQHTRDKNVHILLARRYRIERKTNCYRISKLPFNMINLSGPRLFTCLSRCFFLSLSCSSPLAHVQCLFLSPRKTRACAVNHILNNKTFSVTKNRKRRKKREEMTKKDLNDRAYKNTHTHTPMYRAPIIPLAGYVDR